MDTRACSAFSTAVLWLAAAPAPAGPEVLHFAVETDARLVADPEVGAADTAMKRYAWGDVDQDGDVDLVVVRKAAPAGDLGPRPNVLLMNEGGVLVDRTAQYASASTVKGDQGFLTPTCDTAVTLVDLDGDGWLDIATATASADGLPPHVSHPRVYMNLGAADDAWLGFRYEAQRVPVFDPAAGPRFTDIAAGDLTGDGRPELYFIDTDVLGPESMDYGDRLLVNDGSGHFADETAGRMPADLVDSTWGGDAEIGDLNGDGAADVIRLTKTIGLVEIAYNNAVQPGVMAYHNAGVPLGYTPYSLACDDLNGDGLLDMVVLENDLDPYMLNAGNDKFGYAILETGYFGFWTFGHVVLADVNHDGRIDCLKANQYDGNTFANCFVPMELMANTGDEEALFEEIASGVDPELLKGTRDIAVFDIDGDGWRDLVLGQCDGHAVLLNGRPDVAFDYGGPLPLWVQPEQTPVIDVQLTVLAPAQPQPIAVTLHASVASGPWSRLPMQEDAGLHYTAALPAAGCGDVIEYFLTVTLDNGQPITDPPPGQEPYRVAVASSAQLVMHEDLESDVSGWSVQSIDLDGGAWEHGVPVPTVYQGDFAAPPEDASEGSRVKCFLTQNGAPEASPSLSDVDGGPTRLITPPLIVEAGQAVLRYDRWMFSGGDPSSHVPDVLTVEVSGDGGQSWTAAPHQDTTGTGGVWETSQLLLSPYVELPGTVLVRFSVADSPANSITEAAIDELDLELLLCDACPWDLDGDGATDVEDLVALIQSWGQSGSPADLDGDGTVGVGDLVELLLHWGACP